MNRREQETKILKGKKTKQKKKNKIQRTHRTHRPATATRTAPFAIINAFQ